MWETIALEIIKNIVVPELASFIRKRYEETGTFPTKEELEAKANSLAEEIKVKGNEFLKRLESEVNRDFVDPKTPQ